MEQSLFDKHFSEQKKGYQLRVLCKLLRNENQAIKIYSLKRTDMEKIEVPSSMILCEHVS